MSTLVTLAFATENDAYDVLRSTTCSGSTWPRWMTRRQWYAVKAACQGVQLATGLVGNEAWGGAFRGLLFGFIFFVPFGFGHWRRRRCTHRQIHRRRHRRPLHP
jgi:hypothetical protein